MLYQAHRGEQLQSRRPTRSSGVMPTIGEGEVLTQGPLPPDGNAQALVPAAQPGVPSTVSQSGHSTITSSIPFRQRIARGNYLEAPPSERRGGTSSVQVSQGNYPPLRVQKNANLAPCQWCGKPMDTTKMTENDWRCVSPFPSLLPRNSRSGCS